MGAASTMPLQYISDRHGVCSSHSVFCCRDSDNCRPSRHVKDAGRESIQYNSSEASKEPHQLLLECTRFFPLGYAPVLAAVLSSIAK